MTAPAWTSFGVLIVASLVMVAAMVQFTRALVSAAPASNARSRWGLVYAASWLAILYAIDTIPRTDEQVPGEVRWAGLVAISGWVAFNACWLLFWSAIVHANMRNGVPVEAPRDLDLLVRRAKTIAAIASAVAFGALLQLGAPQQIVADALAPEQRAASLTIGVGLLGFALFISGGVRLALYGNGEQSFTAGEVARAWRSGAWRRDPSWVTLYMMLSGAVLGVVGGFSAGFVMGDGTTRVVLTLFIAFAVFQAWRGWRQGRRHTTS